MDASKSGAAMDVSLRGQKNYVAKDKRGPVGCRLEYFWTLQIGAQLS